MAFNLEEFKGCSTRKQMKGYLEKNCKFIGHGGGRDVYRISNDLVIKVAYDNSGIAQNKEEIQLSKKRKRSRLIARITKCSSNGFYLIMQYAKHLSYAQYFRMKMKEYERLYNFAKRNDLNTGDIHRHNIGLLKNGNKRDYVIIDYGGTNKVIKKYYS